MAATMNIKTTAYFLFLAKNAGVIIFNLVKKRLATGNSNINPNDSTNIPIKEIYLLADIRGVILSLEKLKRNFKPTGIIVKYANVEPKMNNKNDKGP